MAGKADETPNSAYEFTYNGVKYDITKMVDIGDYNGGFKEYDNNGIIKGIVFEDLNYNGLADDERCS